MVQDLPPKGGYGPIQYKRNLPFRGFRPRTYLFIMTAICSYGMSVALSGVRERRELAREKIWARIHLTPMLQAEADRDDVRRYYANIEREKELMKDIENWEERSRIYNSNRFVRPTYTVTPPSKALLTEKEYNAIVAAEEALKAGKA